MSVSLYDVQFNGSYYTAANLQKTWPLIPQSSAKVLPDYIPKAVKDDYKVKTFQVK